MQPSLINTQPTPTRDWVLVWLAAAGCAVASYLTLYQLGLVTSVWEPFFGNGSEIILHSSLARALPVPDASLGALGYLVELACAVAMSSCAIWVRRVYYALVTTFAVASVILIALQWGYFHEWCTLCLTSAVLAFVIAGVLTYEVLERKG